MKRYLIVIAGAAMLGGCGQGAVLPTDVRQIYANCQLEADRAYPNNIDGRGFLVSDYTETCMTARGYRMNFSDPECAAGSERWLTPDRGLCYVALGAPAPTGPSSPSADTNVPANVTNGT